MTIESINNNLNLLLEEFKIIDDLEENKLEKSSLDKVKHLFGNTELITTLNKIQTYEFLSNFNYIDLCVLESKLSLISAELTKTKEEIDLAEFYKRGSIINFEKLNKKFKKLNLKKRFPNFNIDRYKELYENPVLVLKITQEKKLIIVNF